MAFTNAWDESDPPGGQDANTADTEIQQVKVDVRERIATVLPGWADDLEDPKIFPGWLLEKSNSIALADLTADDVEWTTELRDTAAFITVPSTTVTIPAGLDGLYIVGATMGWQIGGSGRRDFILRVNGVAFDIDRRNAITSVTLYNRTSRLLSLVATDALKFEVIQNSGGPQTYGNVDLNPKFVTFWGIRLAGF